MAVNALALSAELSISRYDLNDSVYHYTLADRLVQAIEGGEDPLDHWVSEWSLGHPVPRTYQMLAHLGLAALYFALGKSVSLMTIFVWVRYLLVVLFPLSVFIAARLIRLSKPSAAASALVTPLIATPALYGLDYMSYLWRGSGLFTQALAMHCLALAIGLGYRAVHERGSAIVAGLVLGLTFLSHFVYGYIGALSVVLLLTVPGSISFATRLVRVALIGAAALATSAFQLVPMLADSAYINHSRWEETWKWDSFGAGEVLKKFATGDLLDADRLPVLTLLAVAGWIICAWKARPVAEANGRTNTQGVPASYSFVLLGSIIWLALFCGRPTWGPLLQLLGASRDVPLHRLIGAVHFFFILSAGIALGSLWSAVARARHPSRTLPAAALVIVILWPALLERREFLRLNRQWGEENLAAWQAEASDIAQAVAVLRDGEGRVFSGLAAQWGGQFRIGSVPVHAVLSLNHVSAVAFLYHAMSLPSDMMVLFDERNLAHYRLFGITKVIAPAGRQLPVFLTPRERFGRFQIYDPPSTTLFDLVSVQYATPSNKHRFYDVNLKWLQSDWPLREQHLVLAPDDRTAPDLERLGSFLPLPPVEGPFSLGRVSDAKRKREVYEATVNVEFPSYLLFKMAYHPGWRATIDGQPAQTVMLTPGFIGVPMGPGTHRVVFTYGRGSDKLALLVLGFLVLVVGFVAERRGTLAQLQNAAAGAVGRLITWTSAPGRRRLQTAAGLILLALPVTVPLVTGRVVAGHDAFEYFPRLIEFHENIRHGNLLPRWAPDLSSGYGQPFFLLNPPLFYYLTEVWHLVGFDAVTAVNLASVAIVFASALAMFVLGRHLFGSLGGWLAAAAYIYAPYFLVDLYVRQALAEFAAFPLYPLALYGVARHARERDRRFLLLGALAFAGVVIAHRAAALIFAPLLGVWILFWARQTRSWGVLADQVAGVAMGLALGAFVWVPSLMEMDDASLDRSVEGYLHYTNHFVYLHQLVVTKWGYGFSLAGYQDGMSFALGWNVLALIIMTAVLGRRHMGASEWSWGRVLGWTVVGYCVLMLPGSLWFWDRLALLKFVQFPWRLLTQTVVCLAVLAAMSAGTMVHAGWPKWTIAAAFALLVLPALGHSQPSGYREVDLADWTPTRIAERGIAVTTGNEYEPRWAQRGLPYRADSLRVLSGTAKVGSLDRRPDVWEADLEVDAEAVVEAALFYFPGWTARIDGREVPSNIAEGTGLIQVAVPAGAHRLELVFRRTTPRWIGDGLSVLALLTMVLMWWRPRRW